LKLKRVREFMVRDLTAVSPDATLREVAKILARRRLAGLPVVDEKQRLVGFISEADIIHSIVPSHGQKEQMFLRNFAELTRKMSQVGERKVRDYMTQNVETVREDDDIYALADLMLGNNYKSLPVVREGRLVGIVSRAEVARAMMEETEGSGELQ
jgi:CBS domain-containing protein